jgi:hypothetical protein
MTPALAANVVAFSGILDRSDGAVPARLHEALRECRYRWLRGQDLNL